MTRAPAVSQDPDLASATVLRLATRRSALALAQSRLVGEDLAAASGRTLSLVEVTTRGDLDFAPLAQIGGTGVFVAAVRDALLAGRAELAVHSLKDLPTTPAPGLRLAAVPPREDPRDALVTRTGATLDELHQGARVGTGSPRRRAQLLALRPDLDVVDLRGNVDTRVARVLGDRGAAPDLDAVVLAVAGLVRLGRGDVISERLDPQVMTPAPGQGALAVEALAGPSRGGAAAEPDGSLDAQPALAAALDALDHASSRAAVTAERALLATLGAGCSAPVGALAHLDLAVGNPTVHLRAVLATASGALVRRSRSDTPDRAVELGQQLAAELLAVAAEDAGPSWGTNRPPHQGSHL
jgi:hydroxymethylbilane synthase